MAKLEEFFKESYVSMGVFYPQHYLVAAYEDLTAAERVAGDLRYAGFNADDVTAVEGNALLEIKKQVSGVESKVMRQVSRGIGTEQVSMDHNEEFAQKGAAFVFVYCPHEATKLRAWQVVKEAGPLVAHYYTRFAINHLACRFDTT